MKNKAAFTLIETIIAITLTTIVLTAVTGLILSTLLANQRNQHSLQASYLAEEALEAVRFMRDSNWLQNYSWDRGFEVGVPLAVNPKSCTVISSEVTPCFELVSLSGSGEVTMDNGFVFERSVLFTEVLAPDGLSVEKSLEVTATVAWQERGVERTLELSTYLTDWK